MASYRSIVCIPGFASSRLTLTENVDSDVLWIDLANMVKRRSDASFEISDEDYETLIAAHTLHNHSLLQSQFPAEIETALVSFVSTWWMNHMMLDPSNDWAPLPGQGQLALMQGLSGIEYLDPHGPIMKKGTDVWATLITNLVKNGVSKNQIMGLPYDWRLPPSRMDLYNLVKAIENEKDKTGNAVLVVAHSLGNRVFDYIARMQGQSWSEANIYEWISVGAPWLGAGKAVRSIVTGDDLGTTKMGIGLIDQKAGKQLARSLGSMPWMLPITSPQGGYPEFNISGNGFIYPYGPKSAPEQNAYAFSAAGAPEINNLIAAMYNEAELPFFTGYTFGSKVYDAPPVSRLSAVYGVGINTEFSYFMDFGLNGVSLTSAYDGTSDGIITKRGIRYETSKTLQYRDDTLNSGDGTVPYGSLTGHRAWKGGEMDIKELTIAGPAGEHLAIMHSPQLLNKVLEEAVLA